jgi:roadblock/LC7 domain-containing protein
MIGLDRLIEEPGVLAAGQFTEKGEPIRSVGHLTDPMIMMASKISHNNYIRFEEQIKEFNERTGYGCQHINGWGLWCDKYAICVVGRTVVFVESSKVNFNQLMVDLYSEDPTGARQMNY